MKKYVLGVISDNDLVDKLAQILKLNNWQIMRYTNKELVFLTKGGQKIVFSKVNKLNGRLTKSSNACYCRYNNNAEFLGFVNSFGVFEKAKGAGIQLYQDYREFRYYPAYLNATFKETSIHAIAADKPYRYDLDFYDNLHMLKNGMAFTQLISAANAGFAPSLIGLYPGLSSEALNAFISSPLILEVVYPMSTMPYFYAQGRPTYDKNGNMILNRYGYSDGFYIDSGRSGGGIIYGGSWSYDGFALAFETMLANSVENNFTLTSISFNQNAKAISDRPTSPYKKEFNLDFIPGTSFSDDELSDKMGNDYLYLPQENYIKGNSFIFIDDEMIIIQFGENILILGNGKTLSSQSSDFIFTGVRHSNSSYDKYFRAGGMYSWAGVLYHELYDYYGDLKLTSDDSPLKAVALITYNNKGGSAAVCPNIRQCYKHYNTNKTLKVGSKTLEYIHSSLMTYALLVQIEEEAHV